MHLYQSRIAKTALVAGLGLSALAGNLCTPLTKALAESASITINQKHNEGATYTAYMLFKADISSDNIATHVDWASESMRVIVTTFIDNNGYGAWLNANHPGDGQHDVPQNAAEFIAQRIADSPTDTVAATTPRTTQGLSFANELAQALASNNATPKQTAVTGEAFTGLEGFYLFVTTDSTTQASGEAGTAPIWVPLGGSIATIDEKSAVPTLDKLVQEDSSGQWGKVADVSTAQDASYRLVGTLPTNLGAFDNYHYCFTDTLSEGLVLNTAGKSVGEAITVTIDGRKVAVDGTKLAATYQNNVLTVEFANLKDDVWSSLGVKGGSEICVEYHAQLTPQATRGSQGNSNTVTLTYTDDPVSGGDGSITPSIVTKLFSYALRLTKVDEQTGEPLSGAKFAIVVAQDNTDADSVGKYVQADGSLGAQQYEFETGADGTFTVSGIDEGSYTVKEIRAPQGYERIDSDIQLHVSSQLDGSSLALTSLQATLSGGDATDVNAKGLTKVMVVDSNTGRIDISAADDKQLLMPITGLEGLGSGWAVGLAMTAAAGIGIVCRVRAKRL